MSDADLIAFLNARLEEREVWARAMPRRQADGAKVRIGMGNRPFSECPELPDRERALAESDAMQVTVAYYEELLRPARLMDYVMFPTYREVLRPVLFRFARIYDDHPAFREEWRP